MVSTGRNLRKHGCERAFKEHVTGLAGFRDLNDGLGGVYDAVDVCHVLMRSGDQIGIIDFPLDVRSSRRDSLAAAAGWGLLWVSGVHSGTPGLTVGRGGDGCHGGAGNDLPDDKIGATCPVESPSTEEHFGVNGRKWLIFPISALMLVRSSLISLVVSATYHSDAPDKVDRPQEHRRNGTAQAARQSPHGRTGLGFHGLDR